MLFLMRPRQSYLPYRLPQNPADLETRNRLAREAYGSTRRVGPSAAVSGAAAGNATIADLQKLAELQQSGVLSDEEFAAAKARVLSRDEAAP